MYYLYILPMEITFNDSTVPVGNNCAVSSLNAALKRFTQMNKKGFVSLERIKPSGQIVWVSRHLGRILATLPVFADETTTEITMQMSLEPLRDNELFCHGEYFYRTYLNFNREIGIRAALIFPDELLVRKACRLKGFEPIRVELIRFYTREPREYASTGWLIECANASQTFICFDLSERSRFDLLDRTQLVYETLKFKERFSVNGVWYTLERNDKGLLYASQRRYQHRRPRISDSQKT